MDGNQLSLEEDPCLAVDNSPYHEGLRNANIAL